MALSDIEIIDFPGFPTAVVRYRDHPMGEMPAAMDRAFRALGDAIEQGAFVPAGPAFARYEEAPGETVDFETGFPLDVPLAAETRIDGVDVVASDLPACRLAIARYTGGYDGLGDAWQEFLAGAAEHGTLAMPFWEAYDTEPGPDVDPATLVTGLAVPVRQG